LVKITTSYQEKIKNQRWFWY